MGNYKLQRTWDDTTNLFKPGLLRVFQKLKSIILITRYKVIDYNNRCLSMTRLLSIIKNSSLEIVEVLSHNGLDEARPSWIEYLWKESSSEIINSYQELNYEIQLKYKLGFRNKYHGFVITKQC